MIYTMFVVMIMLRGNIWKEKNVKTKYESIQACPMN
jgi:hypothetical protein